MGLGSTAKKVQKVADVAEQMYERLNKLREEVDAMRETVQTTEERVERLESEMAEQRALLDAVAEEQGIDVDAVSASSHIVDAEDEGEDSSPQEADATSSAGHDDDDGGSDASDTGTTGSAGNES